MESQLKPTLSGQSNSSYPRTTRNMNSNGFNFSCIDQNKHRENQFDLTSL